MNTPGVPVPWLTDILVFPLGGADEEKRAEIDLIAPAASHSGRPEKRL
jgi:hypothetical protein